MQTGKGHLTYCTNIHPGESWPAHFSALQQNFPAIKKKVSPDAPMGIGLRLSNEASITLCGEAELKTFKRWLGENDAYVFTMNGFPYGGFHRTIVKDKVHAPDWTTTERVEYTKRLFSVLAKLLPYDMDGGVSTSPLSYRLWFASTDDLLKAKEAATNHILDIVENLADIYKATGKVLHLDIEPEPDGILETGNEFIHWFKNDLLVAGVKRLTAKYSFSEKEAENVVKQHICLCYDVCHFAIGYEQHEQMIQQLSEEGIRIGKIQVSAALKASMPEDVSSRIKIKDAFAKFNEATYLHQVIALKKDGGFLRYPDLPQALNDAENPAVKEWRAHFHVPVFQNNFGLLESTQADIVEVLKMHTKGALTNHLEVETYTWEVLSESLKLPMQESISRELVWVAGQL